MGCHKLGGLTLGLTTLLLLFLPASFFKELLIPDQCIIGTLCFERLALRAFRVQKALKRIQAGFVFSLKGGQSFIALFHGRLQRARLIGEGIP